MQVTCTVPKVLQLIKLCPSALSSNTNLADECHRLDCQRLLPMILESGGAANLQLSVIQDLLGEVSCLVPRLVLTVTKFTLHRLPTLFMHSFSYIFDFLCPVFRVTSPTQHIGKRDFSIRNSILDVFLVHLKLLQFVNLSSSLQLSKPMQDSQIA